MKYITALFLGASMLLACTANKQASEVEPEVIISTSKGDIVIKLYNETPIHRDNFLHLAETGALDSTLFHRVIKDFMIQGGDPSSRGAAPDVFLGEDQVGEDLPAEFNYPKLFHKRGAIAAARESDDVNPERKSSGSQFYIVWGKVFENDSVLDARYEQTKRMGTAPIADEVRETYCTLGGTPHLDGIYTVFGEVVSGLEVVDSIQNVATNQDDRPMEDVVVTSIKIKK